MGHAASPPPSCRRTLEPASSCLRWLAPAAALLLAACATPMRAPPPDLQALFDDVEFGSPALPDPSRLFELSPAMREYAARHLSSLASRGDPRRVLVQQLHDDGSLRLSYTAGFTRTAAEAFEARAGNCLSLVMMTAAFARHLGLPVSYRQVLAEESYTQEGGLTLASGHVNLVLERRTSVLAITQRETAEDLVVDFLRPEHLRGQRFVPLEEPTIVAMYMNNRAAEQLAAGDLLGAYAHVRAALRADPLHLAAVNTLAVVQERAGRPARAEAALRHVLERDTRHTAALSNLVALLLRQGRGADAAPLQARLASLQPDPPLVFLERGRLALAAGEWQRAREEFQRELQRQPQQPDAHFGAAVAALQLGDVRGAERHLRAAVQHSANPAAAERLSGKLAALRRQSAAGGGLQ